MWVRVKEEGKQCWGTYWRMRGVLDSPTSGERPHPVEGNWDSEDEAEEAGADETVDEVEEQAE